MPYAHQGPANVTVSLRRLGADPLEVLNEGVTIALRGAGTPGIAHLEFAHPLKGPEGGDYIHIQLPNALTVGGPLLQGERKEDGSGWLTFKVEVADGLL